MNDIEVQIKFCKYLFTAFVAIVVAGIGSCQATNYQIRKAIEHGAPPLTARCAIGGSATACSVLEAAEAESVRSK